MQTSAIVSFLHTYALLRKRTQSCILGCFRKTILIQITHREGSPIYFLVAVISAIIVLHRVHNVLCFRTRHSMSFPEFIPILSYSIANAVLYRQRVRCFPLRLVLVKAQQTSAFCDVRHSFGDKWVMSSVVDRRDDSVGSGLLCWDYAIDASFCGAGNSGGRVNSRSTAYWCLLLALAVGSC